MARKADRGKQVGEAAAEWVAIEALVPWGRNPRKNAAAIPKVAESIKRFGFATPITARRADGMVIAGHTRLEAARSLGMTKVPVRYLDISEEDAQLLAIADNKLGEISEWDDAQLGAILNDLHITQPIEALGFSEEELTRLTSEATASLPMQTSVPFQDVPVPDAPFVPEQPVSTRGSCYALGPHRLLCGDATAREDLERLMAGERADLVFTDPPYNVGYVGGTADALTIENDAMAPEAFRQFLRDAFTAMHGVAREGAGIYVCHASLEGENFRGALREAGWLLKQCLIWVKDQFVLGRRDYHWQHEPILYGWAPGAAHRWLGDRAQTTVWRFDRPRRSAEHPTMKPVELIEYALGNSAAPGDVVLDPFGGSGSTLIAAARRGLHARLVELDPRYCDVIRRRWTTFARSAGVDPGSGALE